MSSSSKRMKLHPALHNMEIENSNSFDSSITSRTSINSSLADNSGAAIFVTPPTGPAVTFTPKVGARPSASRLRSRYLQSLGFVPPSTTTDATSTSCGRNQSSQTAEVTSKARPSCMKHSSSKSRLDGHDTADRPNNGNNIISTASSIPTKQMAFHPIVTIYTIPSCRGHPSCETRRLGGDGLVMAVQQQAQVGDFWEYRHYGMSSTRHDILECQNTIKTDIFTHSLQKRFLMAMIMSRKQR